MLRRAPIARWAAIALVLGACGPSHRQAPDPGAFDPVGMDPPSASDGVPPGTVELAIPSSGARMNGMLYLAAGSAPRPVVVLLHGFPGNERNLDLAQAFRRAGMHVLFFSYRGSWGSGGTFSFASAREDVAAAVRYIRQLAADSTPRLDASRIALVGHSLGGWLALQGLGQDSAIACGSALDFWNLGPDAVALRGDTAAAGAFQRYAAFVSGAGAPLLTAGPEALLGEMRSAGMAYDADSVAGRLGARPVLLVSTTANASHDRFLAAASRAGARGTRGITWTTDHGFSDRRIELARTLITWLRQDCRF